MNVIFQWDLETGKLKGRATARGIWLGMNEFERAALVEAIKRGLSLERAIHEAIEATGVKIPWQAKLPPKRGPLPSLRYLRDEGLLEGVKRALAEDGDLLNKQEKEILKRRVELWSMNAIAKEQGITRQRVSQIELRALEKLGLRRGEE